MQRRLTSLGVEVCQIGDTLSLPAVQFCAAFVVLFGGARMLARSERSDSFKCYLQHSRTKKYAYSNLAGLNVRIYLWDFYGSWLQKYLIQNEYFYVSTYILSSYYVILGGSHIA